VNIPGLIGVEVEVDDRNCLGRNAVEARVASSLARLLVAEGQRDEAGRTLAGVYNWFTEGFDTADLREAKALLDVLAGGQA
jgi:adenylate cyclase